MSLLAWRILALFVEHTQKVYKGEFGRGYIATWTLSEQLGADIDAVDIKINPRNEYEAALRELVDHGLVEEMEELHCRFRLAVKDPGRVQ